MKKDLKIRGASEADKAQVLKLLNHVFSNQQRIGYVRDEAYWNWKFNASVYGPSILTVAVDEGKIVGVDHLWPWEFRFKSELLKAVQPCDTVVHTDYRGRGLFKQMRSFGLKEAEMRGYRMAFNFPNENSLPGNRSLGAKYLGKITWWVRILKPIHLINNKLFDLKAENFTLPQEYQLDTEYLDRLSSKYVTECEYLQIHRIPGFYQWRYSHHPSRTYGMLRVRVGKKETALIFTVVQNGASLEMVIVDHIGDMSQKGNVVLSMIQAAKYLDIDFIAVMNNKLFGLEGLWKHKFIKKKLKNMVVMPLNFQNGQGVSSFENWSLVAGLHDSI